MMAEYNLHIGTSGALNHHPEEKHPGVSLNSHWKVLGVGERNLGRIKPPSLGALFVATTEASCLKFWNNTEDGNMVQWEDLGFRVVPTREKPVTGLEAAHQSICSLQISDETNNFPLTEQTYCSWRQEMRTDGPPWTLPMANLTIECLSFWTVERVYLLCHLLHHIQKTLPRK